MARFYIKGEKRELVSILEQAPSYTYSHKLVEIGGRKNGITTVKGNREADKTARVLIDDKASLELNVFFRSTSPGERRKSLGFKERQPNSAHGCFREKRKDHEKPLQ